MSGATPGQAAHPLDLPAMAAYAANYGLSGEQAARRWGTAVENVREHWRMVADAAITASGLGDALTEQAQRAEPQPALELPPEALDIARNALEDIARAAQGSIDASLPADHDWFVSRAMEGLGWLPEGWPKAERPAPELAAAMAETRGLRELVADMLAAFTATGSGHSARVGQVQIAKWRERAGLPK